MESVRRPCDRIAPLPRVWSAPRESCEYVAIIAGFLGLSYFNIFFKEWLLFRKVQRVERRPVVGEFRRQLKTSCVKTKFSLEEREIENQ